MQTIRRLGGVGAVLCVVAWSVAAEDAEFKPLFNGRDMAGFKMVPDAVGKAFKVEDGVIVCSGNPAGYFATEKSFKNYVLRYEWRYAKPAGLADEEKFQGNSGVLVHITGPDKVWPKSIEIQGMNRDHGRMLAVSGAPASNLKDDPAARKKVRKPLGEWNETEITVDNGKVSAKINGTPIASCETTLTDGPIGFQSEGAEIHFRKLLIKELK